MARIRSLKPGFFTNEILCELSPWHRLCFAGLWTIADKEGRLEDRPRRIKAALFPYDKDLDVDALISGLAEKAFVTRYSVDGVSYLAVNTFLDHQRPRSDEYASTIPAPSYKKSSQEETFPRGKVTAQRPYNRQEESYNRQEEEGDGADGAPATEPADGVGFVRETADGAGAQRRAEDFAKLWNSHTADPILRCHKVMAKRRRHIHARLEERPLTEWAVIFTRIQASAFCRGEKGWLASFDWVIGSQDVGVKVLEGMYDDRKKPAQERPFTSTEMREAKQLLHAWGRCQHDPVCDNSRSCEAEIVRKWRKDRGEAA